MSIRHAIWKVGEVPTPLTEAVLTSERQLEEMIVAAPTILNEQWMLIGRQVSTDFGGLIDLLAIAPDGGLVMIELKRQRTPREVVAQAIDYASFVDKLKSEDIALIYARFAPGHNLTIDFREHFGEPLDEETLNQSHQIVIVAASIDESTTRIISYLNQRDIAINVLGFQVFANGGELLLSRAWLLDPTQTQINATMSADHEKAPWNGETYASFGHDESRSWDEAVEHGFICAGGGPWYSNTLNLLSVGDRIWVKVPGRGFVGVGRVAGNATRAADFLLQTPTGKEPALDVLTRGTYHREYINNLERSEYFVPVKWLQTVPFEQSIHEVGMFGNQNTICRPTTPKWNYTIEQLKRRFPRYDG